MPMDETLQERVDARRDAAVEWLMQLRLPEAGEADWLAFEAWLDASPANLLAYDSAVALWTELDGMAADLSKHLDAALPTRSWPNWTPAPTRRWSLAGGLAAAVLAVVVVPWADLTAQTTVYQTAHGERKTVTLADGTRIDMNAGSRLSVKLGSHKRQVVMDDAQAVFDVAADKSRPFVITAGDRTVTVVGTQFDVRHRDGRTAVTVARGIVEVAPSADAKGKTYRLLKGARLDHIEGSSASQVSMVAPDEVLGWRQGRLIYRSQPLDVVASDLNRYVSTPLKFRDHKTAQMKFSGVLVLDDERAVVKRLTQLAPVTSTSSPEGLWLSSQ